MKLLFDFSRVLLFPKDTSYTGSMNGLYREVKDKPGFQFFDYYIPNTDLLDFLKTFKGKTPMYILTSEIIQNDPAIRPTLDGVFTAVFSAQEVGKAKTDPALYTTIAEKLGEKPEEIVFVDDLLANIETAQKAGLHTIHYQSNSQTITDLQAYL